MSVIVRRGVKVQLRTRGSDTSVAMDHLVAVLNRVPYWLALVIALGHSDM